jgi:CheY-like chemotaxis protein
MNVSKPPEIDTKKILVIEDEEMILKIYQQVLLKNGYEVHSAINGEDGLNKIVEVNPDLIFLDLTMPLMDGNTMLYHLKNDGKYVNFKNIPVVILTNYGNADNLRETVTLGEATDFIVKSDIDPNQIIELAKKYTL